MIRSSFFRPMAFCRTFATPAIRDPSRPVVPLTAYFRFADAYRKEKSMKGGKESMKLIGAAWRELPAQKKTPFETACRGDREKYTAAFQKYKDSGALDAWKRDPYRPKMPQSGFFRYLASFRASDKAKGLKAKDVVKEGAKAWKTVDPAEKEALKVAHAKERVLYAKALEQYKASGKEVAWKKKVGIWDKEQKVLEKKTKAKEKKRKLAEKARLAKERINERAKARKLKLKEKESLMREQQKVRLAKEKEKKQVQLAKAKEKKKVQLEKAKEKKKVQLAKAKESHLRLKQRDRLRLAKEKERGKMKKSQVGKAQTRGTIDKERLKIINEITKEKKRLDALTRKLTKQPTGKVASVKASQARTTKGAKSLKVARK